MASIESLQEAVGTDLPSSEWFELDQARVTQFGEATLDQSAIHVDPVWAAPYGGTTVHGLLLLSLVPHLSRHSAELPEGCTSGLNYGFDRVRITSPVKVGHKVRLHCKLAGFSRHGEAWWKKTLSVSMEVEGQAKPALLADWMIVYR